MRVRLPPPALGKALQGSIFRLALRLLRGAESGSGATQGATSAREGGPSLFVIRGKMRDGRRAEVTFRATRRKRRDRVFDQLGSIGEIPNEH